MKSRTKANCEWLVAHLKEHGYSLQVPIREVRYEIAEHIGGDDRTVNKYLHKLAEYGLMKLMNASVMQFSETTSPSLEALRLTRFIETDDGEEPP